MLERGSLRTVRLARALLALVAALPFDTLNLVLDDTLNLRGSKTAPGCAWRHEHSRKTNCPEFVWA